MVVSIQLALGATKFGQCVGRVSEVRLGVQVPEEECMFGGLVQLATSI